MAVYKFRIIFRIIIIIINIINVMSCYRFVANQLFTVWLQNF